MASIVTPNNIGGFDYDLLIKPPDRLMCKICHLPGRDAYLSVCCGHVFCKSCLDNVKRSPNNACPVCRDTEFVTYPNKAVGREVQELQIYCTNKEKGCEWQGELNDINKHLGNSDGCQFEESKCSNKCGKMIERRHLTSHVETECPRRKVNCQYCHDTGEHQFIEGQHKEECPKLSLPCPNNCEVGSVLREDMEAHRKECPLEVIQCEYYSVGCNYKRLKLAHVEFEQHDNEKMKEHLMMTKNELSTTKVQFNEAKFQLDAALKQINSLAMLVNVHLYPTHLNTMAETCEHLCPVTIKMTGYMNKKVNSIQWYNNYFYTHNDGYKMCLNIDCDGYGDGEGTHLSVFLCLMKGPHDDELTWPLRGKFEVKLLNQISDSEHYSKMIEFNDATPDDQSGRIIEGNRSRGWGKQKYISNEDLNKSASCQYLKNDCLFFQITKV